MSRWLGNCQLLVLLSLCLFIGSETRGDAADIEVLLNSGVPEILIEGKFGPEDGEAFANKVSGLLDGIVVLNSTGGSLLAGLRIGSLIRLRNFATVVSDRTLCASACALAWLGGSTRYMGTRSLVGFHAAYKIENGRQEETGAGNALVGAYLNQLGLSNEAIVYITSAPPNDLTLLSVEDARKLGIAVTILPLDNSPAGIGLVPEVPKSAVAVERSPVGTTPRKPDLRDVAKRFANVYFSHWSESNADALKYFGRVYAERVNFVDRPILRNTLLTEKRKFAERWPERIYTTRPETIEADCDVKTDTCTVTGQVEWDCRRPEDAARSAGVANFTLQISVSPLGDVRVNGEWSSVVSRRD
jgi:hypothetical protein